MVWEAHVCWSKYTTVRSCAKETMTITRLVFRLFLLCVCVCVCVCVCLCVCVGGKWKGVKTNFTL